MNLEKEQNSEKQKKNNTGKTKRTEVNKNKALSYEEKLDLMTEYMRETGEKIKADTQYKGYNIGHFQNNLRTLYRNGTLKMNEDLLNKFIESGIISKKPERRTKTSDIQKYNFLMSLVGKTEDELQNATMESGLPYLEVVNQIRTNYRIGKLDLTAKQIENLKAHEFLKITKKEKAEIQSKYPFLKNYAVDIDKKYGSFEKFAEMYKTGKCDYDFGDDEFVGSRFITISSRELTEKQKLGYVNLLKAIVGKKGLSNNFDEYLDIDELDKYLDELSPRDKKIIQMQYGLIDGKTHRVFEIVKAIGVSKNTVIHIELNSLIKLKSPKYLMQYYGNIEMLKSLLSSSEEYKLPIEDCNFSTRTINVLKRAGISYIDDLTQHTEDEVIDIPNMGKNSMKEIREKFNEIGIGFKDINEADDKSEEDSYKTALDKYKNGIEGYISKKKNAENKLARFNIAYKNYMEKENIFDPNGIVPAVPERVSEYLKEKRKAELIASIRDKQQELEILKAELNKYGISLEDTMDK